MEFSGKTVYGPVLKTTQLVNFQDVSHVTVVIDVQPISTRVWHSLANLAVVDPIA